MKPCPRQIWRGFSFPGYFMRVSVISDLVENSVGIFARALLCSLRIMIGCVSALTHRGFPLT